MRGTIYYIMHFNNVTYAHNIYSAICEIMSFVCHGLDDCLLTTVNTEPAYSYTNEHAHIKIVHYMFDNIVVTLAKYRCHMRLIELIYRSITNITKLSDMLTVVYSENRAKFGGRGDSCQGHLFKSYLHVHKRRWALIRGSVDSCGQQCGVKA